MAGRTEDQSKSLLKPWVLIFLILPPRPQSTCLEALTGCQVAALLIPPRRPKAEVSPRNSGLLYSLETSAGLIPLRSPRRTFPGAPRGHLLPPSSFADFLDFCCFPSL